jgi:hypothetical protein
MSIERATAPAAARSGILITTPYEGGPVVIEDTVSCIHCAYTWVWRPGSGKRRGWCTRCNGIVCGRPHCAALGCVHRERLLENIEQGKPLGHVPIVGRVEAEPPRG